ncbi:hypothetical protein B0H12DRAFT_1073029 [Mycena haematopus]|nr:hypothetical protein B0H12DRAFT_1073029 [Mycena haematopus]
MGLAKRLFEELAWRGDLPRMQKLLEGCGDSDCFWLGIQDAAIWRVAVSRLRASLDGVDLAPAPTSVGLANATVTPDKTVGLANATVTPVKSPFSALPAEMKMETLRHLTLPELCTVAATSSSFRGHCAAQLDRFLTRVFAARNLDWHDFRCMLLHTRALISGYFVFHLLFLDSHSHYLSQIKTIEVLVDSSGFSDVVSFLSNVTSYSKVEPSSGTTYDHEETAVFRFAVSTDTNLEVVVHRCAERYPALAVLKTEVTSSFVWMDATGIVVMYPKLTFSSIAVVSHHHFTSLAWNCGETARRSSEPVRGVTWCLGSLDCIRGREGLPFFTHSFIMYDDGGPDDSTGSLVEDDMGNMYDDTAYLSPFETDSEDEDVDLGHAFAHFAHKLLRQRVIDTD